MQLPSSAGFCTAVDRDTKREIREGEKGTARLSEQALALRNWHDALSSKHWKKRHARLNAAKMSAARTRRDGAGGGRPHAPHGGGRNCIPGMNSTLTLLHMPPTMHAQTHGQTRRRTCMVARTDAQTHACTDARTDAQTHGQTHRQTHGQTHRRTPAYACMFARTDAQTHVQTPWTRGTRARGSHRGCDGTVRAHGSREGTAALRQDRTRRKSARGRGNVGGEAREWDGLDRDNMSPQKSKLGKRDGCTASREARIFVRVPES